MTEDGRKKKELNYNLFLEFFENRKKYIFRELILHLIKSWWSNRKKRNKVYFHEQDRW